MSPHSSCLLRAIEHRLFGENQPVPFNVPSNEVSGRPAVKDFLAARLQIPEGLEFDKLPLTLADETFSVLLRKRVLSCHSLRDGDFVLCQVVDIHIAPGCLELRIKLSAFGDDIGQLVKG